MTGGISISRIVGTLIAFTVVGSPRVMGYEIDTHARVTKFAYNQSYLNANVDIRRNLGLLKSRKLSLAVPDDFNFSLGLKYKDFSVSPAAERQTKLYDEINDPASRKLGFTVFRWDRSAFDGVSVPYFPVDWMARGAVREDDAASFLSTVETVFGDRNALDMLDASPKLNRFCNHFYDPVNNNKLDLGNSPLAVVACAQSQVLATGVQWATHQANQDSERWYL